MERRKYLDTLTFTAYFAKSRRYDVKYESKLEHSIEEEGLSQAPSRALQF